MEFLNRYLKSFAPNELKEATNKNILQDVPFVKLWNEFQKVPDDMKNGTLDKMFKILQLAESKKSDNDVLEEESAGEDSDDSGDSGVRINVKSLCKRL